MEIGRRVLELGFERGLREIIWNSREVIKNSVTEVSMERRKRIIKENKDSRVNTPANNLESKFPSTTAIEL